MTTALPLSLRQVHLDFHTSPRIPDVGREFDANAFVRTLIEARVSSVTLFAKCHHGMSYYPTDIGVTHPSLGFDLLGAQIAACHAAGIRTPIYLSAGWDEWAADAHPEWQQVDGDGRAIGRGPLQTGTSFRTWRLLDFASPYADYLLGQTREILERYAPVDGLFFDIVAQSAGGCYGKYCRERMAAEGVEPADTARVATFAHGVIRDFMGRVRTLVAAHAPHATVFHNGRVKLDRDPLAGMRPELPYLTQVEVESIPTGLWGYNHFPLSAQHCQTLGVPILGMTGAFHLMWADFGGVKPEAALRYEAARILAAGGAISVGDQLHPRGTLEAIRYERIGAVYRHVEALEPWCAGAEAVPEIGVLLAEHGEADFFAPVSGRDSDEGAMRMLMELHRPAQFLDRDADFAPYAALIAPDDLPFDAALAAKMERYLDGGGALLLTHRAGLTPDGDRFALDTGAVYEGESAEEPDYLVATEALGAPFTRYHQVLYERGSAVRAAGAAVLAWVGAPYFTRLRDRFTSHEHAPYDRTTAFAAVAQHGQVIYCSSPLFRQYRHRAVPAYRDLVGRLLDRLAPARLVAAPDLPTTAEVALLRQPAAGNRTMVHLIHAVPQRRGDALDLVEDVLPLHNVSVGIRAGRAVTRAHLAPQGDTLTPERRDGQTWVTVPVVRGHQVVVFELAP